MVPGVAELDNPGSNFHTYIRIFNPGSNSVSAPLDDYPRAVRGDGCKRHVRCA